MTEDLGKRQARYFNQLYSSRRRLNRRATRMERMVAERLFHLTSHSLPLINQWLESDLEWLLTWKLKKGEHHEFMWCDGVKLLDAVSTRRFDFHIKATVQIGVEGRDELHKVSMEGSMTLKPNGKEFKRYSLEIFYRGTKIEVCKNLTHQSTSSLRRRTR